MTLNQQRFADEYIRTGNAKQAYMAAYKTVTKDGTAEAAASRLLRNVKVAEYIEAQREKLREASIADAKEIMVYLTSVMRGEVTEQKLSNQGDVVDVAASTSDRSAAAKQLARMLGCESMIDMERLKLEREKAQREKDKAEAKDSEGILSDVLEAVNGVE